ncbi:hypothetical protein [Tateyamaria pelophila]|uniref:hypothetical protein n=1 Tax=Tateyamaria pelophila TaxID=328415 RepID=UPI001CBD5362|nr:hypothetical protein [Tateyamaria pelophila]
MSAPIDIPAHEVGRIRLFSLSLTDSEAKNLQGDAAALQKMLGADVDTEYVDVFPLSNLEGVGLAGFLRDGNAVSTDQLAPDRGKLDKLDALGGWVLIVYSSAFRNTATTLTPAPALTLIGTYGEAMTDWTATETVRADAAKPFTAPPETVKKRPSDAAMSGRIATIALIVMFALTALIIWIAA